MGIFDGNVNPTVDTTTTVDSQYPAWLQQRVNTLINQAYSVAQQPYQAYTGQRVAGFSPEQFTGFSTIGRTQGGIQYNADGTPKLNADGSTAYIDPNWQKYLNDAGVNMTKANAVPTATGAAQTSSDMSQRALDAVFNNTPDTLGLTAGLRDQQQRAINRLNEVDMTTGLTGYLNKASGLVDKATGGQGAYDVALDYLGQGTQRFPEAAAEYMNPYASQVTDRLAELAGRNLSENLLPAVNETFTKAGQFGSSRNADFTNRAIRDTQNELLGRQGELLRQGYVDSGNQFSQDQGRALTAAGTAGSLYGSDLSRSLSGAGVAADLGAKALSGQQAEAARATSLADRINAYTAQTMAAQNQDVNQRLAAASAAQQQGKYLADLGSTDVTRNLNIADASQKLGAQQQRQDLAGAAAQEAVGQQKQQLNQQGLNVQYQDFLNQRDYPMQMVNFLSSTIRGMPYNTQSTTQYNGPANSSQMAPSPLAQIAGAGAGVYGMGKAFNWFKAGGRVKARRPARGLSMARAGGYV